MSGSRYRILASTALALILATPIGSAVAQEAGDSSVGPTVAVGQPAPLPAPAAAPSATAPGAKYATASTGPAKPAAASEQPAAPAQSAAARDAAATGPSDAVSTVVKDGASTAVKDAPADPAPSAPAAAAPAVATPAADPTNPTVAAEQPAQPPDPMAAFDPADRAVAEKIRDLFADKAADKIFVAKKERNAAEAFYQTRNFAPLWLDKGVENARAKAAIARLQGADADGLDIDDYKTPNFAGLSPDAQAEAELKLTQTLLTYARHVQAGRFPYTRVSHNMELAQNPPDPADVLAKIAAAADTGKALDDLRMIR
jgi:murein L,D-transpeptidase YcbB/YkuD